MSQIERLNRIDDALGRIATGVRMAGDPRTSRPSVEESVSNLAEATRRLLEELR